MKIRDFAQTKSYNLLVMALDRANSAGMESRDMPRRGLLLSPLAGRGRNERVMREIPGEGAFPQAQTRGYAPYPPPPYPPPLAGEGRVGATSPRKRGEVRRRAASTPPESALMLDPHQRHFRGAARRTRNPVIAVGHALTRRNPNPQPEWTEYVCAAGQSHVRIGTENYYLSGDGRLMPAKKGQSPPDLRYFKQSQN